MQRNVLMFHIPVTTLNQIYQMFLQHIVFQQVMGKQDDFPLLIEIMWPSMDFAHTRKFSQHGSDCSKDNILLNIESNFAIFAMISL